jgi:UDP-2,3-diacylglucosamine pyrophosphatase LpxH
MLARHRVAQYHTAEREGTGVMYLNKAMLKVALCCALAAGGRTAASGQTVPGQAAASVETAAAQAAGGEQAPSKYYFISDLHIGGDGDLNHCTFEQELIGFLRALASEPPTTELIIAGDAFGLWELTEGRGREKLEYIASTHPALFEQFRQTGGQIRITLMPGNHDYDLACYPAYPETLAKYGIRLDTGTHITRPVGERRIWIEHGNQRDEANTFPDWGDPYGQPVGYFITAGTVAAAGRGAEHARSPWLSDLESVYPTEAIPGWVLSNYFYHEMGMTLRWCLLPFLLLFTFSAIVVAGRGLERVGILPTKIFHAEFRRRLGTPGRLIDAVIWVNGTVIVFLLVLAVPAWFVARDARATLLRYGVDVSEDLSQSKDRNYVAAAKAVFDADPSVALFIYGHTHSVSVREVGGRYVINTGTWLKRVQRVTPRIGMLPAIYIPSYRLNYFAVSAAGRDIRVEYREIPKHHDDELTLLQRLVLLGKRPPAEGPIPREIVIPGDAGISSP